MFFKSLELTGFKSFPDKIDLTFEKGITCVVGPNGSGKSNISDAIRWVMGEQSVKTLRGGKMEDVIFSGTQKRKPLGFCEVSLIVDNKDRGLNIDFDEVMVTRRIFRSGESEYYINKSACRLKDIQELFMDTGLGKDGYSLVGQGKIDSIISGKPSERRTFFEEACGISKYHHKKDEAERKLNHTNDNIIRINDIVAELETQLEPLKLQSEKAKKYLILRDELKELEVNVWLNNYYEFKSSLDKISDNFKNSQAELENTKKTLSDLDEKIEQLTMLSRDIQEENDRLVQENYNFEYNIKSYETQIEIAKNNIEYENQNIKRIQEEEKELKKKISDFDGNKKAFEEKTEALRKEKEQMEGEALSYTEELNRILNDITSHNSELSKIKLELAEKNNKFLNIKAKKSAVISLAESLNERILSSDKLAVEKKTRLTELEGSVKIINENLDALEIKEKELKEETEKIKEEYNLLKAENDRISGELSALLENMAKAKNRIDMLVDMENNNSLSPKAVKELLSANLSGVTLYGTVASLIKTDSKYAQAIDTALGAAANNVVCENENDAKKSIEFLKKSKAGRVTFMPLMTVKPQSEPKENLSGEKGFVGLASKLISCDAKYTAVAESLLNRTFVFENIDTAINASKKYKQSIRIVTLTGEIFSAGGSITGGEFKNKLGAMQRNSEIDELKKSYDGYKAQKEKLESTLSKSDDELDILIQKLHKNEEIAKNINSEKIEAISKLRYEKELYDSINKDLENQENELKETKNKISESELSISRYNDEIIACQNEITKLEALISETDNTYNTILSSKDEINEKISSLRFKIAEKEKDLGYEQDKIRLIEEEKENFIAELERKSEQLSECEDKILDINDEIEFRTGQIAETNESISEYKKRIEENKLKKADTEKELSESQKSSKELREKFVLQSEEHTRLEVKVNKINSDIEQTINNLWESYELTITTAEELKKDIGPVSSATRKISDLKSKIKGLGNINIDAIEEYKNVNERYTFLINQRNDLTEAKTNLETIISDMIKMMKQIFSEQFALIAKSFNDTYIELFGGGRAELSLTEPENVLESGIEIEVQPPGKKLTTISLLSGGEKAFTAIALLFAIIKVKPTPFCMFDEIEAALDDNNVYRYADYLKKFKKDTQFIVITHRRGTMEAADTLYGVTMQEKGVSKLLSINIDEIEKEGLKN